MSGRTPNAAKKKAQKNKKKKANAPEAPDVSLAVADDEMELEVYPEAPASPQCFPTFSGNRGPLQAGSAQRDYMDLRIENGGVPHAVREPVEPVQ